MFIDSDKTISISIKRQSDIGTFFNNEFTQVLQDELNRHRH